MGGRVGNSVLVKVWLREGVAGRQPSANFRQLRQHGKDVGIDMAETFFFLLFINCKMSFLYGYGISSFMTILRLACSSTLSEARIAYI
jgi:hypothetical protein